MIYFDNAATTQTDPEVLEAMLPYFSETYGNPSSLHSLGREAKVALDTARKTAANILNCDFDEIIFTSGGTESNNLALKGTEANTVATTKIEHPSILETNPNILLSVDHEGFLNLDELEESISAKTLVSVIYANNEIGTIQDIPKIAEICHKKEAILHTDACQAANYLSIDTKELGIDLMTLNSAKIYGPKGMGLLFVKKDTPLQSQIHGGPQEFKLRAGTENLPGIIGFIKALEISQKSQKEETARLSKLRDQLITQILTEIPDTKLNGPKNRLANNINISFPKIEGKELVFLLDHQGIACSTGSACHMGKNAPSHTLTALGLNEKQAKSAIRFSLGKHTKISEIEHCIDSLKKIFAKVNK